MDEAGAVGGVERAGHVEQPAEALANGHGLVADVRAQAATAHELHRDEGHAFVLPHVVDDDDVGVVERGHGPRLADQARPGLVVDALAEADDLERDAAVELVVQRAVHRAHAALAEEGLDEVAVEGVPRLEHAGSA